MTKQTNRLSQADLAGALADAVSLETKRIESIDAETVDQIGGGVITVPTSTSPTLPGMPGNDMTIGMYPTQPTIGSESTK
jgi:hypothetical protein